MKKLFLALSLIPAFMPIVTKADVVSSDDIKRLTANAQTLNDGCKLVDFALHTQGGGMNAVPDWKILKLSNGISLRFPWSPIWYLVGKQIPWFEKATVNELYSLGRFQTGEACSINREYTTEVAQNKTIKQRFSVPLEGDTDTTILDTMVINGNKVALVEYPLSMCEEQAIAIEVKKGKATHTVIIKHQCGLINAEMIRMAASVK